MAPSFASLLCGEDNSVLIDDNDDCYYNDSHRNYRTNNEFVNGEGSFVEFPLMSEECVTLMVEKEREYLASSEYLNKLRNGGLDLGCARIEVVDWIKKVHAHFSFGPLSAYLSINYLDRFLSAHEFPKRKVWMMQLLAVACLSIASKMDENEIPLSVDLQIGDSRYVFDARTIQRMELLVLSTLRWRMQAVTPFSFIDYFLSKMDDDQNPPRTSISRSIQLILSTIKGIDFLEFRPSEVAAAVAMSVTRETQTTDIEKSFSLIGQHVDKGRVLKCIELMTNLGLIFESFKGSSSSVPSVPQSPLGVLDATCWSYKSDDATTNSRAISSGSSPDHKRKR